MANAVKNMIRFGLVVINDIERIVKKGRVADIPDMDKFLNRPDVLELGEAKGCYIFALKPPGGSKIVPWYVGRTTKQNFKDRWKTEREIMVNVCLNGGKGKLMLFAFPALQPTGKKFANAPSYDPAIKFLEEYLIGIAWKKNNDLLNVTQKHLSKISVPGIVNVPNAGNRSDVKTLWKMLGKQ